jgi:hypothetical protein
MLLANILYDEPFTIKLKKLYEEESILRSQ